MTVLNKEPVKRAKEALKKFNSEIKVIELEQTARTSNDDANSLNTEVGSIVKSLLFMSLQNLTYRFIFFSASILNKVAIEKWQKSTILYLH